jgi:alkanesulfonate monooxygenase SsuD/methylene tetrahydromethanopterin reductase-like flavin-dependent oxidoreductase (luciferase family)
MELGLQMHPSHPPGTDTYKGAQWDLQVIRWADEYGYSEIWVGEHYTIGWEPVPSPEILIAQAFRETKRIRLAAGAHLLPYHNPMALAHRIAYLDHLSQGRLMVGIGAGAHATDVDMFQTHGKNHEMMIESYEIMLKVWEGKPFNYKGKYWSSALGEYDPVIGGPFLVPFQKPYPPIAMAGLSPRSPSLGTGGELGLIPLSLNLSPNYLSGHWDVYAAGAAKTGKTVSRKDWRVGREFFIADTEEEAFHHATKGAMGRAYNEFLLPLFKKFGMGKHLTPDANLPEADLTPEYLAKHVWLVGTPETVEKKLRAHYKEAGGFGTALGIAFDYSENPEPFRRSLELMAREVMPRVKDLTGE